MRIDEFEARMTEVLRTTRWKQAFARAVGRNADVFRRWDQVPEWAVAILELLEVTPRRQWPERFSKWSERRSPVKTR